MIVLVQTCIYILTPYNVHICMYILTPYNVQICIFSHPARPAVVYCMLLYAYTHTLYTCAPAEQATEEAIVIQVEKQKTVHAAMQVSKGQDIWVSEVLNYRHICMHAYIHSCIRTCVHTCMQCT